MILPVEKLEKEQKKNTSTCMQLKSPREGEGLRLTCPQPGAPHTKGFSSPIFAKTLQCNCGGREE